MGGVSTPWGWIGVVVRMAERNGGAALLGVRALGQGHSLAPGGPQLGPGSPGASRLGAVAPTLNREKLPGEQLKLFSIQLFPVQGAARW